MLRNFKVLGLVLVIMVLAGGAYAFAAANTVPASVGGGGTGAVSGYVITNIVYDLDAIDPSMVSKITFNISPIAPTTLFVQAGTANAWKDNCTNVDGAVTCDYASSITLESVNEFNVVANGTIDPNYTPTP